MRTQVSVIKRDPRTGAMQTDPIKFFENEGDAFEFAARVINRRITHPNVLRAILVDDSDSTIVSILERSDVDQGY